MTLHELIDRIAADEAVARLVRALASQRSARLYVAPLIAAARPPVTAVLARIRCPVLLVMPNADTATRAYDDLCQWIEADRVLLFPASDAMPYEHMSPGVPILGQRLAVLHAAARTDQPLVVVTAVKALMQPTLTPAELAEATMELRAGMILDPQQALRRWIELGYRTTPLVEEPGELCQRGGIVDLWPPGSELPLRIEWFGDEVDSLRSFDPITQRSEARLAAVRVGPPNEIPLWRRATAIARLDALDLETLRREARDEWVAAVSRLELGERFEGRAFFGPFFREPAGPAPDARASLLSHLPGGTLVVLSDGRALAMMAAELHRQSHEHRADLELAGELPREYPRPYLLWEELFDALGAEHAVVDLSATEEPSGTSFSLPDDLFLPGELFGGQLRRLVDDITTRIMAGERAVVVSPQAPRIEEMVRERVEAAGGALDRLAVHHGALDAGFRSPRLGLTVYSDTEIFGWRQRRVVVERRRRRERSIEERAAFLRGLKHGDYVVHIEHGIAMFEGLLARTVDGITREYLHLRYADGDRLYVPVDQVDRVSRYIGVGDAAPQLTRLGTQDWERTKRKVRAAIQDLAGDLLNLYAARQLAPGHAFSPDTEWQRDLEAAFPYIETGDQLRAIAEVKQDMERRTPMDRLICGDVGFGKTEVALRAAFKAVQDACQVAVLVPTTVLAQQHFDTFSKRMAAFPVRVEMISRFRTAREQEAILADLASGKIDIIIGTHRLLSKDVHFKNLGLLVVDEEQRFGVRHKERLKQLRTTVDVLTLTATPIPRTLHMALSGIRDLSVIDTPPEDRLPVKTYVVPYDDGLVRDAIMREIERGGQVYFVHNRVQTIYYTAERVRRLVPEARIAVGHGQLDERTLERVMIDFFHGEYDVLVCTTIIESGLDVPSANTIIIDDAPHYGLAQLYQLRGRVGRSSQRAYAYLLYRQDIPIGTDAQQRLEAIQEATELGAGFRIAMRDLEIRGAGNLLGGEQSGNIAAIGFDLYSRLLEQAVHQLKQPPATRDHVAGHEAAGAGARPPEPRVHEKVLVSPLVTLDLPLTAYLPVDYIPDDTVRLSVYQRLADTQMPEQVRAMRQELRDRFGDLPEPAAHLVTWLLLKALALRAGVTSVITTDEEFVVRLPEMDTAANRERLRRRFGRDAMVKIGPQFVRLDRRALPDQAWVERLTAVLETLER